jgi:hypothetical protein
LNKLEARVERQRIILPSIGTELDGLDGFTARESLVSGDLAKT